MDERSERIPKADAAHAGKRKYEPPEILSQEVFETTALACRKISGQGARCNSAPQS